MKAILEVRNIHKHFPGVYALQGVNFYILPGEVHALMGENGAGKSTLIKILAGVYDFEEGEIIFYAEPIKFKSPYEAIKKGISVIYQELNLSENISVAENIFFGRLPQRAGKIDWKKLYTDTKKVLNEIGLEIEPGIKVESLSIAQRQLVEIGKALSLSARVIIMDEPTSALCPKEIKALFNIINGLKEKGVGIVYVSHKLDEIMEISDRITVLRDGQFIATHLTKDISPSEIISMMVGRSITETHRRMKTNIEEVILDVNNITNDKLKDISFYVRKGEIVGFSGLMGAGRTELAKAVFGFDRRNSGKVKISSREVPPNSPPESKKAGIGYIPEDRKGQGIFSNLSVKDNISIASLKQVSKGIAIQKEKEFKIVNSIVASLKIKTPSLNQLIAKLSGGNQQKCIIARWLVKDDIKVLIVDEPTRGIDVGAKSEIYSILEELTYKGMAVIIMSSELPEILGICDRIYVMREGRITGEFARNEATQEKLIEYAIMQCT